MRRSDLRASRGLVLAVAIFSTAAACGEQGDDGGAVGAGRISAPVEASPAVQAASGLSHLARPRDLAALDERLRQHYPRELRASGRRGSVLLDVGVDARGVVTKVEVVAPPPEQAGVKTTAVMMHKDPRTGVVVERIAEPNYDPAFGPAARAALRGARFWPAQRDGRPVASTIRMGVEFTPPAGGL
jgi:outer membrane biosynthesis protein TonB